MSATATLTPANDAPQHLRALARANEVRLARAELKRRVADGDVAVADLVLDCPWEAASMPIAELLMSQRRGASTAAAECSRPSRCLRTSRSAR